MITKVVGKLLDVIAAVCILALVAAGFIIVGAVALTVALIAETVVRVGP